MKQHLACISLLVKEYDEAIQFFSKKLHFEIIEDIVLSKDKRWVVISPSGSTGCAILLAKAANQEQRNMIGNQTGGRVFLFLHTDDFSRDFENLKREGIRIVREPSKEYYGTVAVFEDLYGNLWDLLEPQIASESNDWREKILEEFSQLVQSSFPMVVKETKWRKPSDSMKGIPVWSCKGIICTGETYKDKVKFTFAKGASINDPKKIFNSGLEGKTRRAIDLYEGDKLNKPALQILILRAIELNKINRK